MAGTPKYPILIFWSDEDECFVADVPDLRYCSAFGDTPEEALAESLIAQEAWLESAREHGRRLPVPTAGAAIVAAARELDAPMSDEYALDTRT